MPLKKFNAKIQGCKEEKKYRMTIYNMKNFIYLCVFGSLR